VCVCVLLCLRVDFVLKTARGYPKDSGVTLFTLATPENPLHCNTLGQLYQSPPLPIPGDWARSKWRHSAELRPRGSCGQIWAHFCRGKKTD